ncbi:MAG: hypothetical protein HOQ26_01320 [Gemmatimonadaceae bacterium]|nr:hypothetical protein [Gemmatimonadaceae bacterium]NUQ91528.1 hypothetical protein [Gemmatimonadaceae bacterium]
MPATFPRTILPNHASWPAMPTGLVSTARSGVEQVRTTTEIGRTWTERFIPFKSTDATARAWIAQVLDYYRNMTEVWVDHRALRTLLGTGAGSPVVNGASQSGSYLITDGWTASSAVLKAGDVVRIAGLRQVFDVVEDITADGSGNAVLHLNPPIYAGGSPADNAALTLNTTPGAVLFRARVAEVVVPEADADDYYIGVTLTFRERVGPIASDARYLAGDSTASATFTRASSASYVSGP